MSVNHKLREEKPVVEPVSSPTGTDTSTDALNSCPERDSAVDGILKKSSIATVLVSGIALFSDGYTVCIIGYMEPILKQLYPGSLTPTVASRLSNSFLIGEIFGMLFFGFLIDRVGRRAGVIAATTLLVLGVVLSTAAHGATIDGMLWMMTIGRGVAGFGAGGEYPVCATGSTEAADETKAARQRRGVLVGMSTLFAIDFGFVISGVVAVIVLLCYNGTPTEGSWRICFGLAMILPIAVFFFRLRIINSTQFRKHAIKHNPPYLLALKLYWKPMLGSTLAWFFYDFNSYPFGLYSSSIVARFDPSQSIMQSIGYGTVVNCFLLPGAILGGFLMDVFGRKQTMTLGFTCCGVIGFIIGGAFFPLLRTFPVLVVLYGLFNATAEMGPGVATILCATESFPTPLRGHFVGLAAAVGKVGAVIGTQVFNPIIASFDTVEDGQQAVFLIAAAFAFVGAIVSWVLLPNRSRRLEDEDAWFRRELLTRGYDISCIGEDLGTNLRHSVYDAAELCDSGAQATRF